MVPKSFFLSAEDQAEWRDSPPPRTTDWASARSTSSQVSPIFFPSGKTLPKRSCRFLPPQILSWASGSNSHIAMAESYL
ncbi:MAG: hypothetical protein EB090_05675 [Verrucomicrobia bacterium]|nr:hypothetical protein [Verrucomicrobiota bacterium]